VSGTPASGGAARSAPTSASHHSCACNGSVALRTVAAAADPHVHNATRTATRRRRPKSSPNLARVAAVARAYIGLGSNLGDREATLRAAVGELAAAPGVEVVGVSTLIDTEPVGLLDQPRFLNGVLALETELPPRALLGLLIAVEARFGRDRAAVPARGPRTLDLDLLVYGEEEIDEPGLRVPHPRLHERAFVLRPLAEVEPDLIVPGKGPIRALVARLH
jgi:2-amino-4-hydroxy-6-hydroxymethyldihydropteridine diphosphokinase